jgi:alkylated DNA repair dioxygenase AlkB
MQTIFLSDKSFIQIHKNIIDDYKNDYKNDNKDYKELVEKCPTEKDVIKIFGKSLEIPRFQKLYGTGNVAKYSFSGITLKPEENIPELVKKCINKSKELFPQYKWEGALVNWYLNGEHYIGPHSDDEKDLVKDAPICSYSFGATRQFKLKSKKKNNVLIENISLNTFDNSLIVMGGSVQKEFKHEVPKMKNCNEIRINITVRSFV